MKVNTFINAMGNVDDEFIVEAQSYKKAKMSKRKVLFRLTAACLAFVVIGTSVFMLNRKSTQSVDTVLRYVLIPVEGKTLSYKYLDMSEDKVNKFEKGIYEKADGMDIYRLTDEDNFLRLIVHENGTYSMVEYLETACPIDYKFILSKIYGISSEKDIKKLVITDQYDNKSTKIVDDSSKEKFYNILSKIEISEPVEYEEDLSEDNEQKESFKLSPCEYYEIEMFLQNGEKYMYQYNPKNNFLYGHGQTMHWSELSGADNDWLSSRIIEKN